MFIRVGIIVLMMLGAIDAGASQGVDVIAGLIERAALGDRVVIPAGVYEGNLRIDKSVELVGNGNVVIDGLGEGTVIEIDAPGVTLSGLVIRGSGRKINGEPAGVRAVQGPTVIESCRFEDVLFGIDLRGAPGSVIRKNTITGYEFDVGRRGDGIRLWWSPDSRVEDNEVFAIRDLVFWYSENLHITGNRVEGSRYGLHCMYIHHSTLTENVLVRNSVGIYLMYSKVLDIENNTLVQNRGSSGYGIGLKDCDDITVDANSIQANRVGVYVDNSPSSVDAYGVFKGNQIAFNEVGMLMTPITHDLVLSENGFIENEEQVAVHGSGDLSLNTFSSEGRGNYWSDYAGFDGDGDGVGDLPYEAISLFESLLAREPNLRLFVHSPAQQAVEFTSRALPEMRPEPKFVDASPLMMPPTVAMASMGASQPILMLVVAGALLGGACFVLVRFGSIESGMFVMNDSNKERAA